MVLGVQWLQCLGPIIWDFKDLEMTFTFNGKRHVLRGTKKSVAKKVGGKAIDKVVYNL